ncbi:acyl carrier protein [Streptomyces sp. NPDC001165]|uniref:acyl carrier protein n=1 Tax=Streptomyces sp. NPDC001165 TaxID=3364546 RepID=UPI0036849454
MPVDPRLVELLPPFLKFMGDHELTAESDLRSLGLDSMQAIELLFAIEDTFGVVLQDDDLTEATFATVEGLWSAVQRAGEEQGVSAV